MEQKKEIVKMIQKMSGRYSAYTIFADWIMLMAIAFQNACYLIHNDCWTEREQKYIDCIGKYQKKEQEMFRHMTFLLVDAYEQEIRDYLGEIYMEAECGNKNTGQFFTPFHLSLMTAQLSMAEYKNGEKLKMNEPSTGGGGMILATARVLKERGINYQEVMEVVAQDLDWNGVYMSYVQLFITGINAVVVQGDTLKNIGWTDRPKECIFRTAMNLGVI